MGGAEFQDYLTDVIESQEQSAMQQEQVRMREALNSANLDYSITANDSLDLFTIQIREIVGTQHTEIEISGPYDVIPAVNNYIIGRVNPENTGIAGLVFGNDTPIDFRPFNNYGLNPDEYTQDIDEALNRII